MPINLNAVFEEIKPFYKAYEKDCVILHDVPGKYYLGTHEVRAKDGYRTWFGGVEIKKNYVSAHLIPVYAHPEMLGGISAELRKRMQGKSCFNFKVANRELLAELKQLIDEGFRRFKSEGRV